jgi:hypothetical protein
MRVNINGRWVDTDDLDDDVTADTIQFGGASGATGGHGRSTTTIGNLHASVVSFGNNNTVTGGVYYETDDDR